MMQTSTDYAEYRRCERLMHLSFLRLLVNSTRSAGQYQTCSSGAKINSLFFFEKANIFSWTDSWEISMNLWETVYCQIVHLKCVYCSHQYFMWISIVFLARFSNVVGGLKWLHLLTFSLLVCYCDKQILNLKCIDSRYLHTTFVCQ